MCILFVEKFSAVFRKQVVKSENIIRAVIKPSCGRLEIIYGY